jgi:DNA gyrase subunit B
MPQLILNGNLFIAVPPLFRINYRGKAYYFKNENEVQEFIKCKEMNKDTLSIQRFKGLGEMSPEQLWESTMNPETRTLKKVVIENFIEADKIFGILMGGDVEIRREFIEKYSNLASLDI